MRNRGKQGAGHQNRKTQAQRIVRARKSQKAGGTGEAQVLADLLQNGHHGMIQRRRSIRVKGRTIYPDNQGCDIIGTTKSGRALYVEVKNYSGKSVGIGQNSGLLLSQLAGSTL